MDLEPLYLRGNVVLEPLFSRWYVWSHLVSPMTAPLYVVHQHLKIMQGFVAQPQIHVAATKNPELIGGPYIHYGVERVGDVRALIERTTSQQARLIDFAAALKSLDTALNAHPRGMSFEDLYPKVPEPLRGLVELTYDVKNQPALRLIEGLLYRTPVYNEEAQSVLLWRMDRDERAFIFSTPRLDEPDSLHLERPFRHASVDALAALQRRPAPLGEIREVLGVPERDDRVLRSLLTPEPPPPAPPRHEGSGMRIRYFGHACVLLESKGVSILTDPVVSYAYPTDLPRFTLDDLPEKIDYVLISHSHADHFMLETLLRLRGRIGTIVVPKNSGALQDPSLRLALKHTGFHDVVEVEELDEIGVDGGSIVGLPFLGEHGDLAIRSKLAFLVRLGGRSAIVAADSNALEPELYRRVRSHIGDVDALFLGMECEGAPMSWSYGPLLLTPLARKMDQSRRLSGSNCERAEAIVSLLDPKRVYIYAMGQEPWLGHVMGLKYTDSSPQIVESNRLIERCRASGRVAERPYCQMEIVLE